MVGARLKTSFFPPLHVAMVHQLPSFESMSSRMQRTCVWPRPYFGGLNKNVNNFSCVTAILFTFFYGSSEKNEKVGKSVW